MTDVYDDIIRQRKVKLAFLIHKRDKLSKEVDEEISELNYFLNKKKMLQHDVAEKNETKSGKLVCLFTRKSNLSQDGDGKNNE